MKKLMVMLALLGLVTSCESKTELGRCVGVDDEDLRDPALVYKVSTQNVILGVLFIETIFAPIIVLLDETYCPVAKKAELSK